MTEMTKIPQPEIEAYHAGHQAGYVNGKRDAVRHGYWIQNGDKQSATCSACGKVNDSSNSDYCSFCGVKIIGEMEYKMLYHSAFPD